MSPESYCKVTELKLAAAKNGAPFQPAPGLSLHYEYQPGRFAHLQFGPRGVLVRVGSLLATLEYRSLVDALLAAQSSQP